MSDSASRRLTNQQVTIIAIVGMVVLGAVAMTFILKGGSSNQAETSSTSTFRHATPTTRPKAVTTTSAPALTTAPPQATTTAPPSIAPFVGSWYMHDGGLIVNVDGTGTMSWPGIQYAGVRQTVNISVSATGPATAIAMVTTGTLQSSSTSYGPGTTIYLDLASPGVQTSIGGSPGFNFCDKVNASQQACGA